MKEFLATKWKTVLVSTLIAYVVWIVLDFVWSLIFSTHFNLVDSMKKDIIYALAIGIVTAWSKR